MVAFAAYFDASGHPDNPSDVGLFVAGVVGTVDQWKNFNRRWPALLAEHKITGPFHMTDFEGRRGPYGRWTDEQRAAFYSDSCKLVKKCCRWVIAHGVHIEGLNQFRATYVLPYADYPPFVWTAMGAMLDLHRWISKQIERGLGHSTIDIVFEHGDKDGGAFRAACRDVWGHEPRFSNRDESPPLQVADLLAWEFRTALKDGHTKQIAPRPSCAEFIRHLPIKGAGAYASFERLYALAEQKGWEKRDPPSA